MKKLNKKTKTADLFFEHNMLYRRNWWDPNSDHGKADALWRTSLGLITYNDIHLHQGILECFTYERKTNIFGKSILYKQGFRCNQGDRHRSYKDSTISRDQVIMALAALKLRSDVPYYPALADSLRYNLSPKHKMTPDMWLWVKHLAKGKKIYAWLFCKTQMVTLSVSNALNKVMRYLLGYKDYGQYRWYATKRAEYYKKRSKYNWLQKKMDMLITPTFSYHLTCWMIYCLPDMDAKTKLQKKVLKGIEGDNLLLRMLMGDKVSDAEISSYLPMIHTFRWQSRLDGSSSMGVTLPKLSQKERVEFNTMDIDILYAIKELNKFH